MKSRMRKIAEGIFHGFVRGIFTFVGWLPKKELYFFESFHGKQYSDNPRAFYEYLQREHPELECIWTVKKGFEDPLVKAGVPFVSRMGIRWLFTMPRAKYWIFNTRMPDWMIKPKRTVYVQTWHGTPLKRLGLDIEDVKIADSDTAEYRREIIDESARWDYLLSPNQFSTKAFRSAFGYEGEILEIGYPRNDILLKESNTDAKEMIYESLNISKGKKIILYAPTWRDDEFYKKGNYKYKNHFPFEKVLESSDEFVILLRTHYLVGTKLDLKEYGDRVVDCSKYEDIRDLYLISDVLVTDYSSVMFDFAYTGRPMLFFMYDYQKYEQDLRGFYFDPQSELPGPIISETVRLVDELQAAIGQREEFQRRYGDSYKSFVEKYCFPSKDPASGRLYQVLASK